MSNNIEKGFNRKDLVKMIITWLIANRFIYTLEFYNIFERISSNFGVSIAITNIIIMFVLSVYLLKKW